MLLPAGLESDFTTASSTAARSTSTATVAVNDQSEKKHEGVDVVIDNLDRKHEGEDILISRSPSHDIEEAMIAITIKDDLAITCRFDRDRFFRCPFQGQ